MYSGRVSLETVESRTIYCLPPLIRPGLPQNISQISFYQNDNIGHKGNLLNTYNLIFGFEIGIPDLHSKHTIHCTTTRI